MENNSGNYNSGDHNSGYRNSGYRNSGDRNSGYYNSGDRNSGDYNSGYYNSGYYNSGDHNSGNYNSGDHNSGDRNSGNYNSGDYNSGYCNTDTPKIRIFNKESNLDFGSEIDYKIRTKIDKYQKPLCEWISSSNMTDTEKANSKTWETTQGYLKVNEITFNGNDISVEDEEFFRGLPNFDEEIFKTCTGIDLSSKTVKIVIDGKNIQISKAEFENIKKQFCN